MIRSIFTWLAVLTVSLCVPLFLGPDASATPVAPWMLVSDDDDSGGSGSSGKSGGSGASDDDDSGGSGSSGKSGGSGASDDDDSGGSGGSGKSGGSGGSDDDDSGGCGSHCDPTTPHCFADQGDCPCGNEDPNGGCANGSGLGAFITGEGSDSVLNDDLVLTVSDLPPNTFGQFLMARATTRLPLSNSGGLLCVAPPANEKIFRMMPGAVSSTGTFTEGPGIVAFAKAFNELPIGEIDPGETWYFQFWFRDMGGPCEELSGTSNAVGVTFTP